MTELTPTITQAVESGAKKLLEHFSEKYGSMIFIPLGVDKNKTPAKIAPNIAESIRENLITSEENKIVLNIVDEKIGVVFDSFMDNFYNSLNFIAKGIMKALELKMSRSEFYVALKNRKEGNPKSYETWKNNFTLVLQSIFDELVTLLKNQGKEVEISDGNQTFESPIEGINNLELFK